MSSWRKLCKHARPRQPYSLRFDAADAHAPGGSPPLATVHEGELGPVPAPATRHAPRHSAARGPQRKQPRQQQQAQRHLRTQQDRLQRRQQPRKPKQKAQAAVCSASLGATPLPTRPPIPQRHSACHAAVHVAVAAVVDAILDEARGATAAATSTGNPNGSQTAPRVQHRPSTVRDLTRSEWREESVATVTGESSTSCRHRRKTPAARPGFPMFESGRWALWTPSRALLSHFASVGPWLCACRLMTLVCRRLCQHRDDLAPDIDIAVPSTAHKDAVVVRLAGKAWASALVEGDRHVLEVAGGRVVKQASSTGSGHTSTPGGSPSLSNNTSATAGGSPSPSPSSSARVSYNTQEAPCESGSPLHECHAENMVLTALEQQELLRKGQDHEDVAWARVLVAKLRRFQGRNSDAKAALKPAMLMLERVRKAGHGAGKRFGQALQEGVDLSLELGMVSQEDRSINTASRRVRLRPSATSPGRYTASTRPRARAGGSDRTDAAGALGEATADTGLGPSCRVVVPAGCDNVAGAAPWSSWDGTGVHMVDHDSITSTDSSQGGDADELSADEDAPAAPSTPAVDTLTVPGPLLSPLRATRALNEHEAYVLQLHTLRAYADLAANTGDGDAEVTRRREAVAVAGALAGLRMDSEIQVLALNELGEAELRIGAWLGALHASTAAHSMWKRMHAASLAPDPQLELQALQVRVASAVGIGDQEGEVEARSDVVQWYKAKHGTAPHPQLIEALHRLGVARYSMEPATAVDVLLEVLSLRQQARQAARARASDVAPADASGCETELHVATAVLDPTFQELASLLTACSAAQQTAPSRLGSVSPVTHKRRLLGFHTTAMILMTQGDVSGATELLQSAVNWMEYRPTLTKCTDQDGCAAALLAQLSLALRCLGRQSEAVAAARDANGVCERAHVGQPHAHLPATLRLLAAACVVSGDIHEAETSLRASELTLSQLHELATPVLRCREEVVKEANASVARAQASVAVRLALSRRELAEVLAMRRVHLHEAESSLVGAISSLEGVAGSAPRVGAGDDGEQGLGPTSLLLTQEVTPANPWRVAQETLPVLEQELEALRSDMSQPKRWLGPDGRPLSAQSRCPCGSGRILGVCHAIVTGSHTRRTSQYKARRSRKKKGKRHANRRLCSDDRR